MIPNPLRSLALPLAAIVLGALATALCRAAAGVSLGLFFGGVLFITWIVPPLTAGETTVARRLTIPACAALGVALVWLAALGEPFTLAQWIACSTAMLAYALALGGASAALVAARLNATVAAATVTLLGLLWLTWPVWLSRALLYPSGDTAVAWLVPAHPLFAINGVLPHLDTWDRYRLAYTNLTVLNQDVFYALPPGVFWATGVHGLVAGLTFGLAWMAEARRLRALHPL